MVDEDPAMRWAREQIEDIFADVGVPHLPTGQSARARPTRAPVVACLLVTAAFFLLLMTLTFLVV